MSPTEREGGALFLVWIRWHDSFLSARCLMNWLEDFNQIYIDLALGHYEELIRFW